MTNISEQNQTALYPIKLVNQRKTSTDNNYISPVAGIWHLITSLYRATRRSICFCFSPGWVGQQIIAIVAGAAKKRRTSANLGRAWPVENYGYYKQLTTIRTSGGYRGAVCEICYPPADNNKQPAGEPNLSSIIVSTHSSVCANGRSDSPTVAVYLIICN